MKESAVSRQLMETDKLILKHSEQVAFAGLHPAGSFIIVKR